MKRTRLLATAGALAVAFTCSLASAQDDDTASVAPGAAPNSYAGGAYYGDGPAYDDEVAMYPYSSAWHAGYSHTMWGRPLALVVPPTARRQTIWSWGVSTTQVAPINAQFTYPSAGYSYMGGGGPYLPSPYWPTDTRQFGVYYIRGPW